MKKVLLLSVVLGPGLTKINMYISENYIVTHIDIGKMFKDFPKDEGRDEFGAVIELTSSVSDLKNKTKTVYNKFAEVMHKDELKPSGKWTAYPPSTKDFSNIGKPVNYDSISDEIIMTHLGVPYVELKIGSKFEHRSKLEMVDKYISEEHKKYIPSIYQCNENIPDHPFVLTSGTHFKESGKRINMLEVISMQEIEMTKKEYDALIKGKLPFIDK